MDPYLGEIRIFAGNFPPAGWVFCDGRELPLRGNEALYSLLGTTWGGDGSTKFNVPDLRGRLPIGQGQGTALTARVLAQKGGSSTAQITVDNLPTHNHNFNANNTDATTQTATAGCGLANTPTIATGKIVRYAPPTANPTLQDMDPNMVTTATGNNQPHNNLMPYMALNYIMCTVGLYPERP